MPLSAETVAALEESLVAVDEFYETLLAEIDRDVRNLREYGTKIEGLATEAAEEATDEALSIIEGLMA